ncbi:MAG: 2,3-bisphosphoglycerate-independent phosphoglycerate mutase [Coriobacteriia bacterium]|nr:2,3-bisphosphoglycerate-independent phosphoglycerate mutase [Coriobacteriia bacterium]
MKYIVVILDGAADLPLEDTGTPYDSQTTLEAASIPVIDLMARQGRVGLARTVPEGFEPSSAAACTSILGYDPVRYGIGRGAIEAAGMGVELKDDEVALRVNTLIIEDGVMSSYACDHIETASSRALIEELALELNDDTFTLHPGIAYRHLLVVKGHPELLDVQFTPPHDITDQSIDGHLPRGGGAAGVGSGAETGAESGVGSGADLLLGFMERAHKLLPTLPANLDRIAHGLRPCTDLWPFWPGVAPTGLVSFSERFGKTAALSSGVDLLGGMAVLFGLTRLEIDGVTDGLDNDFARQATESLGALDDHDLVVIHIEAPDEEGHAGSVQGKIAALEKIDSQVMTRVLTYAKQQGDEGARVLVMPDHPTPIALMTHTGEPVPWVLWGSGITESKAPVSAYSEYEAADTGILLDPATQLMELLLSDGDIELDATDADADAGTDAPAGNVDTESRS